MWLTRKFAVFSKKQDPPPLKEDKKQAAKAQSAVQPQPPTPQSPPQLQPQPRPQPQPQSQSKQKVVEERVIRQHDTRSIQTVTTVNSTASTVDPATKPLPPIIKPTKVCDKTIVIVTSGTYNIGKSTLIRLGLQNLTPDPNNKAEWQCHRTHIVLEQVRYPVDIVEMDDSMIDINQDPPEFPKGLTTVHGGLICYDTTNRDSMDCLPDLLNTYISRNIPSILVGLKADLSGLRQVDLSLGQKLGNLFGVELFEVDAFSEEGIKRMKDIYTMLITQCIKDHNLRPKDAVTDSPKIHPTPSLPAPEPELKSEPDAPVTQERVRLSSFSSDTSYSSDYRFPPLSTSKKNSAVSPKPPSGFVFAPTAGNSSERVEKEKETAPQSKQLSQPTAPVVKRTGSLNEKKYTNSRRGSKDSSESVSSGLTVEDIIEKVLAADLCNPDERSGQIFITFYRKFMKPYDLVKGLIERFENDSLVEPPPTLLQEKIHSLFVFWLSQNWNDFHSRRTRQTLNQFIDRIAKDKMLRPMCDSLLPLIERQPPPNDPDAQWGLVDSEEDPSASDSAKHIPRKDSGAYTSLDAQSKSSQRDSAASSTEPAPLKRTSSSSSFSLFGRSRKSSLTSSIGFLASIASLSPMTAAKPSEPPAPAAETNTSNSQSATTVNPTEMKGGNTACKAEFAGGLINLETLRSMSSSPSWSSFGAHTLSSSAASFISAFGGYHKADKEQNTYKMFMDIPDQTVAEQLTWVEAELFSKVKAREFVRNIWSTHEEQARVHSAVIASIAHFNFISAWVATLIVTQAKVSKRANLFEKFITIAVELRNHNNYNTLMAILAGLNSAPILRLKQTREAVADKKVYKQFQSLERLMSSDKSFSSYRLALKASDLPGIPYLGIHNQDLVSLAEANKDNYPDGTIHWEKFKLMGECICTILKFQNQAYDIEPDGKILRFIADHEILSENEQYQRSNLVEPRLKSSSTNKLRDLWLRV